MLPHQFGFEGVGVVEVESGTGVVGQVVQVAVVGVVVEDGHLLRPDRLYDAPQDGALAGARPARYADHHRHYPYAGLTIAMVWIFCASSKDDAAAA